MASQKLTDKMPTVLELLYLHKLNPMEMTVPLSHNFNLFITKHMDKWEEIALYLIPEATDREDINQMGSTPTVRRVSMLNKWMDLQGNQAHLFKLIEVFLQAGRRDLADKVCEYYSKEIQPLSERYFTPSATPVGTPGVYYSQVVSAHPTIWYTKMPSHYYIGLEDHENKQHLAVNPASEAFYTPIGSLGREDEDSRQECVQQQTVPTIFLQEDQSGEDNKETAENTQVINQETTQQEDRDEQTDDNINLTTRIITQEKTWQQKCCLLLCRCIIKPRNNWHV